MSIYTKALKELNEVSKGFTRCGSLIVNPNNSGCIIDMAFISNKWFVVFNDDRDTKEGFESLDCAVKYFLGAK